MDAKSANALQTKLETVIREGWRTKDPEVRVTSTLRADGKIDITVVSHLFESQDGQERESAFWPVFADVPKAELIYMTYCLLLTPAEAARNFDAPNASTGTDNEDRWA